MDTPTGFLYSPEELDILPILASLLISVIDGCLKIA
jgi:hypothetical protein